MKKLADICYTFVHGKNASWNRHVQYILIGKPLKIKLIIMYRLLFSNFPNLIHVEKLSASTMIPKEVQFTEILACQNSLNRSGVAKFPIHFVLGVSGACNKRRNNPRHVIDTSDSEPDLERAVNSN